VPNGGVNLKRLCTYRPSVIYLIVNKLLSHTHTHSLSSFLSHHIYTHGPERERDGAVRWLWESTSQGVALTEVTSVTYELSMASHSFQGTKGLFPETCGSPTPAAPPHAEY